MATNQADTYSFNKNAIFIGKTFRIIFHGLVEGTSTMSPCYFSPPYDQVFLPTLLWTSAGSPWKYENRKCVTTLLNWVSGVQILHQWLYRYVSKADQIASVTSAVPVTTDSSRAGHTLTTFLYLTNLAWLPSLFLSLENSNARAVQSRASRRCSYSKKICPTK